MCVWVSFLISNFLLDIRNETKRCYSILSIRKDDQNEVVCRKKNLAFETRIIRKFFFCLLKRSKDNKRDINLELNVFNGKKILKAHFRNQFQSSNMRKTSYDIVYLISTTRKVDNKYAYTNIYFYPWFRLVQFKKKKLKKLFSEFLMEFNSEISYCSLKCTRIQKKQS